MARIAGIDLPREKLYERINNRVDKMVENGLYNEVENFNRGRNDMKIYDSPWLEILIIDVSDVLTTSPGDIAGDNEFEDPFN